MARTLDQVVKAVAAELMPATATNAITITERVLHDLVDHFGVSVSFLRHHEPSIRKTTLVAQWPPRDRIPDPDPIGVVYFADADPIFARCEHLKGAAVVRPGLESEEIQRRIEEGTAAVFRAGLPAAGLGWPDISLACVPLRLGDLTTGILGFIKYGDREWHVDELNALQAIATLFAQLQVRVFAEEQLHYLAEHDDLSGLLNRRALIAHLEDRLTGGQQGPVAVLFLDVDRLKTVNGYFGVKAGDAFIKIFAERLGEGIDRAVIARMGGDEFVVVPKAPMDVETAELLACGLRERLQEQVVFGGEVLTPTVSIGVAAGVPGVDSASDLLRRTDQAALAAKGVGGGKVAVFTAEMSSKHEILNDIELHLEGVIDNDSGSLVVHYLPEVDMRSGEILGTEALVRWQHPTRGLLLPDSFIRVAESINLADKLGRLVMRSACAEFSRWREVGVTDNLVLRINVSPVQLVSDIFVGMVASALDEFDLFPSSICLEITESVVVQDIEATRATLAELKDVGVQIALDDFGTGHSVLTHLKSLPVDTVKIDKGFVHELGHNAGDLAIVRVIMGLADAFELQVVAEGVETVTAARTLLDLGCHRAQGFLLSRPVDGDAMQALLARRVIPVDFLNWRPDNSRCGGLGLRQPHRGPTSS